MHVFDLPLSRSLTDRDVELLDAEERARASRFLFERDRHCFVSSHAAVRRTLGALLERSPESLTFTKGRYGKPQLTNAPQDLRFNLSHAGELALLAVTVSRDVGVDLEQERPVEVLTIAERFFSEGERQSLREYPPAGRKAAFFRGWTRKEAFIKALGSGLTFPLDGFEVSLTDSPSDQLLLGCSTAPDELDRWRIRSLVVPPGYTAAVAAGPGDWRVRQWPAGD